MRNANVSASMTMTSVNVTVVSSTLYLNRDSRIRPATIASEAAAAGPQQETKEQPQASTKAAPGSAAFDQYMTQGRDEAGTPTPSAGEPGWRAARPQRRAAA